MQQAFRQRKRPSASAWGLQNTVFVDSKTTFTLNKSRSIPISDFNDEISVFAHNNAILVGKTSGTDTFEIEHSDKFVSDFNPNIPDSDLTALTELKKANQKINISSVKILTFEIPTGINYFILIGFESGHVKVLLPETGDLILSKWLNNDVVVEIKQDSEKVDIIYHDEIVSILNHQLFDSIRTAKASLALHKAKSPDNFSNQSSGHEIDLTVIKSKAPNNLKLNSAHLDFPKQDNIFDQLLTASLESPDTFRHISNEPIAFENLVLAADENICNFGVVLPRENKNTVSNLTVQNVGNLLTGTGGMIASGVSSFWNRNKKPAVPEDSDPNKKPIIQIEKPYDKAKDQIISRYSTEDLQRSGLKVASKNHFSLISDNLGRVWLIDNQAKCVTRCWKGYRNAECSFLDDAGSIIAILAPVRNILEIYSLYGDRLAAFNVPAGSSLRFDASTNYGKIANI